MTFGIVLANADQIILATDRRLTWGSQLIDDSATKAGHAVCDDGSFLYCFTGLARVGKDYITSRWLLEALTAVGRGSRKYQDVMDGLAEEATRFFRSTPFLRALPSASRRLTIMLPGYTADGLIVNTLISNYQDFTNFIDHSDALGNFTVHEERSVCPIEQNPTLIQVIGRFHAFGTKDELQLREMLERRVPAEALRQKAVALIQEISDRPTADGTVGKKVTTARLDYSAPLAPFIGYESDETEATFHLLDKVDLRTGAPEVIVADIQLTTTDGPIVFPKVHRNAPCPCGSGKKYRYCHRP